MKTIGPYKILGLLGRGGMGKVYRVEMPTIGKIAALKRLDPHPTLVALLGERAIRRRFISEAITMAEIRHPHIADILGFDEVGGVPFYLMEYYPYHLGVMVGESLRVEAPSRMIRIDRAIEYTRQTLEGLKRLHYEGIVHRDIKPFNLLITDQDVIKICDFGLSKLRGESFQIPPGLKVGSPFYASPEQETRPEAVGITADLYSAGVVLHRMVTGRLPTEGSEKPSSLNPDLDSSWDRFFGIALSRDPDDRFQTAGEMLEVLEQLRLQWESRKEKACAFIPPGTDTAENHSPRKYRMRTRPLRTRPGSARELFHLDPLWRPEQYLQNNLIDPADGTVRDRATELLWEKSGSPYPLSWPAAVTYIDRLNDGRFAGRNDWRLPTIDELATLLTEPARDRDYCIEPVFSIRQKWLWSCDHRSFTAAWYVSIDLGFVGWQDFSGYCYVRGVCRT